VLLCSTYAQKFIQRTKLNLAVVGTGFAVKGSQSCT
jgi:hypothetical protein